MTRYDLSESKVSIPTSKKGGFPYFEMADYDIFRFFDYFFIELSCVYFDTYKKKIPKEFFCTCSIYVYFDSNECSEETLIKLCSRKRGFLRFCPPAEKTLIYQLIS